ncbi:MAG: exosome complex RNA-binding protein Csl4 [Candidatus Thermoplasmatota archaeon]|jgi:exosome complex component CSL4|nr:exosome complex RNA-binding protein Csl4 [Candidatus Thermoplasmatota archaeon]
MNKNKMVLPGDQLATSEELSPGDGTFEEDGIIRSARVGIYVVDEKYKKAMVKPLTSVPVLIKKGDIVLATITSVKPNMAIADVMHVVGKKRAISGDTNGTIKVSEIAPSYVKEANEKFSIGDIVRAKVTQVTPSLQLTTKESNLGVIKAVCGKCRQPLTRKSIVLECKNCGNVEKRKIASDYGEFDPNKF